MRRYLEGLRGWPRRGSSTGYEKERRTLDGQYKVHRVDVYKEATTIAVMNSAGKLAMESIVETKAATNMEFLEGCVASCMSR